MCNYDVLLCEKECRSFAASSFIHKTKFRGTECVSDKEPKALLPALPSASTTCNKHDRGMWDKRQYCPYCECLYCNCEQASHLESADIHLFVISQSKCCHLANVNSK
jgi:hypothetical protein